MVEERTAEEVRPTVVQRLADRRRVHSYGARTGGSPLPSGRTIRSAHLPLSRLFPD